MDEKGMNDYNADGGSVEMIGAEHSPGMEVTTGSLGQGISQAAGIAFARKVKRESGRVVMFMSDGECQSGQFWEAVQAASYHRLGNMLIYVDVNGYQCDGKMTTVMNLEPFDKRLKAFGAKVFRIDGHDIKELVKAERKRSPDVPTFVLCDTDPCRGMTFLQEREPKLHYIRFSGQRERDEYQQHYDQF
jgi:transketolase